MQGATKLASKGKKHAPIRLLEDLRYDEASALDAALVRVADVGAFGEDVGVGGFAGGGLGGVG